MALGKTKSRSIFWQLFCSQSENQQLYQESYVIDLCGPHSSAYPKKTQRTTTTYVSNFQPEHSKQNQPRKQNHGKKKKKYKHKNWSQQKHPQQQIGQKKRKKWVKTGDWNTNFSTK